MFWNKKQKYKTAKEVKDEAQQHAIMRQEKRIDSIHKDIDYDVSRGCSEHIENIYPNDRWMIPHIVEHFKELGFYVEEECNEASTIWSVKISW